MYKRGRHITNFGYGVVSVVAQDDSYLISIFSPTTCQRLTLCVSQEYADTFIALSPDIAADESRRVEHLCELLSVMDGRIDLNEGM